MSKVMGWKVVEIASRLKFAGLDGSPDEALLQLSHSDARLDHRKLLPAGPLADAAAGDLFAIKFVNNEPGVVIKLSAGGWKIVQIERVFTEQNGEPLKNHVVEWSHWDARINGKYAPALGGLVGAKAGQTFAVQFEGWNVKHAVYLEG